jgi:putative ABC transport system substrate-binding protein
MAKQRVASVIVANDAFFSQQKEQIARIALKNRILTLGSGLAYAQAGFLITYGAKYGGSYRRAAALVDKIIKGAKPAELPVEQPMQIELAINLKTAKALGIKIPDSIMLRADKVIE